EVEVVILSGWQRRARRTPLGLSPYGEADSLSRRSPLPLLRRSGRIQRHGPDEPAESAQDLHRETASNARPAAGVGCRLVALPRALQCRRGTAHHRLAPGLGLTLRAGSRAEG